MNFISKLFNLKNKTVILTGSAGRLGTRFAHVLSAAGADVVLVDIEKLNNKRGDKQCFYVLEINFTVHQLYLYSY